MCFQKSRNFKQNAIDIGVDDEDSETEIYDITNPVKIPDIYDIVFINIISNVFILYNI